VSRRLCAKGRQPIRQDLVKLLGIESLNIQVAAICVYHAVCGDGGRALEGSSIKVRCAFVDGISGRIVSTRCNEWRRFGARLRQRAHEIDVVITRAHCVWRTVAGAVR